MDLPDTFELLQRFERCANNAEIDTVVLNAANEFGVEYYLAGMMPPIGSSPHDQLNSLICGSWPIEWSNRYFHQGYIDKDPTIAHVRNSNEPLIWSDAINSSKDASKVMHEAKAFHLGRGITLAQCSLEGYRIGISFAGDYLETDNPSAITALTVISSYAVAAAIRVKKTNLGEEIVALTPKEKEVLYWVSKGKTGFEISIILDRSTATVEKHFRNLMQKLGVQNRAHAVAEALRKRLIT